jgi:hypothetical protein
LCAQCLQGQGAPPPHICMYPPPHFVRAVLARTRRRPSPEPQGYFCSGWYCRLFRV